MRSAGHSLSVLNPVYAAPSRSALPTVEVLVGEDVQRDAVLLLHGQEPGKGCMSRGAGKESPQARSTLSGSTLSPTRCQKAPASPALPPDAAARPPHLVALDRLQRVVPVAADALVDGQQEQVQTIAAARSTRVTVDVRARTRGPQCDQIHSIIHSRRPAIIPRPRSPKRKPSSTHSCRAFSSVSRCASTVESLPPLAATATRSPRRKSPAPTMVSCTSCSNAA